MYIVDLDPRRPHRKLILSYLARQQTKRILVPNKSAVLLLVLKLGELCALCVFKRENRAAIKSQCKLKSRRTVCLNAFVKFNVN